MLKIDQSSALFSKYKKIFGEVKFSSKDKIWGNDYFTQLIKFYFLVGVRKAWESLEQIKKPKK